MVVTQSDAEVLVFHSYAEEKVFGHKGSHDNPTSSRLNAMLPESKMENAEVEGLEWFHPTLNRHHAEALLIQNGQDGSYLLRASTSRHGEYSLSVRCANSVKHFQIGWDGRHYTFGMGRFSNLKDFIAHFENKPLIGGESGVLTLLKFPYPRNIEEPDSYDTIRVHAEWGNRPSSGCENASSSINSKEGYLTKQGHVIKSWKSRWFVLCKNELKYYKSRGDIAPIKTLDLNQCLAIEADESTGRSCSFRIEFPNRTFYVFASSDSERDEWLGILRWKLTHKN